MHSSFLGDLCDLWGYITPRHMELKLKQIFDVSEELVEPIQC